MATVNAEDGIAAPPVILATAATRRYNRAMQPGRVLLTQAQIRARVRELGGEITRHYGRRKGVEPVFLGIMNGALFFLADLLRAVRIEHVEVSCVRLASYEGTQSTGKLRGLDGLGDSFRGRHVLVVDDILDSGRTLAGLTARLKELGAAEVKTCVLLEKKRRHEVPVRANWTGFRIADEFVVGYGLDYNGRYRSLKQVQVLKMQENETAKEDMRLRAIPRPMPPANERSS